ncbi:MAG: LapA family protein [Candidatus Zixiibacteriota bacterium]
MKAKHIIILIIVALFLIILFQNTQEVTLRLFFWQQGMSLIILLAVLLFLGFIIGYVVAKITGRRQRSE